MFIKLDLFESDRIFFGNKLYAIKKELDNWKNYVK